MTVSVYDDRRADDRESQRVYLLPWQALTDEQRKQAERDYPGGSPEECAYTVDRYDKVTGRYEPFGWRAK